MYKSINAALEALLVQLQAERSDGKVTVLEPSTMRLLAGINAAAARNHIATDWDPLHKEDKR